MSQYGMNLCLWKVLVWGNFYGHKLHITWNLHYLFFSGDCYLWFHVFIFLLNEMWVLFLMTPVKYLKYIFSLSFQRSRKSPLKETSNDNLSPADQAWEKFRRCDESLIRSLFYGQQKSTVRCCKCSEESVTFEAFSDLSLPLPSSSNKCSLVVSFWTVIPLH